MTATLILHCGAKLATRDEIDAVPVPPSTETWCPIGHGDVLTAATTTLETAGFQIAQQRLALARDGKRFFGVLDLTANLANGCTLAVAVRNSMDKSFPMGLLAGSRVAVCDNLAFSAELTVRRKHTTHGHTRFREAISLAIGRLDQFQAIETNRIAAYRDHEIGVYDADAFLLDAFRQGIVSVRSLPLALRHWDHPEHEDFQPRTVWALFNAFTSALSGLGQSNPQDLADRTMRLRALLDPIAGLGTDGATIDPVSHIPVVVDHDDLDN